MDDISIPEPKINEKESINENNSEMVDITRYRELLCTILSSFQELDEMNVIKAKDMEENDFLCTNNYISEVNQYINEKKDCEDKKNNKKKKTESDNETNKKSNEIKKNNENKNEFEKLKMYCIENDDEINVLKDEIEKFEEEAYIDNI
jgi:hypothetical protein